MINKKIFLYGSIFVLAGGAAATAGYLLGPSKTIDGAQNMSGANDDEEESGFVPVPLNARDHFIDNLSSMKTLDGNASISLSYKDTNIYLTINELNLTLETLNDINAYVDATVKYNNVDYQVNVTFVDNTIYASLLDTNIKFEVSEFTKITDLLDYFNVNISLPEEFSSLDMDSLINKLGSMEFNEIDNGYEYKLNLLDGLDIYFYSDKEYNFTSLKADALLSDLSLELSAEVSTGYSYSEENKIGLPNDSNTYNNVSNVIPLAKHIGNLLNQKKFNFSLNGDVYLSENSSIEINGSTQFDIESKVGLAKLNILEHHKDGDFNHNIDLDITESDAIFSYNDSIKGKIAFANISEISSTIEMLMNYFSKGETSSLTTKLIEMLDGSAIKDIINGNYDRLLNKLFKNIIINEDKISFDIDKSFANLDKDMNIELIFDAEKIISLNISDLSISNKLINLSLKVNSFDENYKTSIDRNNLSSYSDYANLVPLMNAINNFLTQSDKKYALGFSGSLTSTEKQYGLSFNGKMRFDLSKPLQVDQSGDGEITIVEEESTFDPKPSHNVKVSVTGTDALFEYNNSLHGKFTVQTLRDMFGVAFDLIKDNNSRIYQWFGDTIENLNETVLMRIANGEFDLLFHNVIKNLSIDDGMMSITVAGSLLNLDNDLTIKILFDENNLSSVEILGLSLDKYKLELKANVLSYNESATAVASEDEATYYDFSYIKTLLKLGLNVANLDYFHITGNISMTLKFVGVDLKGLADMKNLPIEIEIFENNGNISLRGKITNIPQQTALNGGVNTRKKTVEFFYKDNYVYISRTDNVGGLLEETKSVKATLEDFSNNIIDYTLGFGLNLSACVFWNSIKGAMTETSERTTPIDYSKILTNFVYTNGQNDYGQHRWDISLNMAEIANNPDLKSCNVSFFGKQSEFQDDNGEYLDYLSHLLFDMFIEAGSLSVSMSANLDLVDVDPNLTYLDFETSEKTKDSYQYINNYVSNHINDSSL